MRRRLKDVNPDWWSRLFIASFIITIAMFTCTSCEQKRIEYRYRIEGQVPYRGGTHPAVWLTDTFDTVNGTLIITNSDSSKWTIAPPYTIKRIK